MATAPEIMLADSRGRITLGSAFANCTFLVEKGDDCVVIRPARVIPEREAWLYANPVALDRVRKGLAQARNRQFVQNASLDEVRRLIDETPEE